MLQNPNRYNPDNHAETYYSCNEISHNEMSHYETYDPAYLKCIIKSSIVKPICGKPHITRILLDTQNPQYIIANVHSNETSKEHNMASAAEIFVQGPENSNPYKESQFCIIQEAGNLLGDMQAASDRLKLNFLVHKDVDSELCVDLFADFVERFAELVKDGEQLAADETGENETVEKLRDHLREIETDVQSLTESIGELRHSNCGDIADDINGCEEESDRIYNFVDPTIEV